MKIRKLKKLRMITLRHAPKWHNEAGLRSRKDGIYYENYCCRDCYWSWGWSFENRHCYKTDCRESNYRGLLKKYWRSSEHQYSYVGDE